MRGLSIKWNCCNTDLQFKFWKKTLLLPFFTFVSLGENYTFYDVATAAIFESWFERKMCWWLKWSTFLKQENSLCRKCCRCLNILNWISKYSDSYFEITNAFYRFIVELKLRFHLMVWRNFWSWKRRSGNGRFLGKVVNVTYLYLFSLLQHVYLLFIKSYIYILPPW